MTPLQSVQTKAPETRRKQFLRLKKKNWAARIKEHVSAKQKSHLEHGRVLHQRWRYQYFMCREWYGHQDGRGNSADMEMFKKSCDNMNTFISSAVLVLSFCSLSFSPSPFINQQHSTPRQSLSLMLLHPLTSQVQQATLPHSHFLPTGPRCCATFTVPFCINQQEQSIKCNMQWERSVTIKADAVSSLECKFRLWIMLQMKF